MPGLNIDCLNNPSSIDDLKTAGVDAVRLVSKPDPNGPGVHPAIEQYLADCKAASIFALVIVTSESQGRIPANNAGWVQFGNEPDVVGAASWTMDPEAYVEQFNLYAETYPQFNWIAAGLAAGDYSATFWKAVAPRLSNCAGFALHPYLKTPDEAVALVQAHQAVTPDALAFVTEFNCSAADLPEMLAKLRACTAGQYWYAASDQMNPGNSGNCLGFGLLDHPDKLTAWQTLWTPPQPTAPAAPEFWVDCSNYQGPLSAATLNDMKRQCVVGIISQAITGLNGISYTRQQLQAALDNGMRVAGYAWNFAGVSVARRLPLFDGFPLEFLALDVEQAGSSIAAVNRDLALCDTYTGNPTWIYTAPWYVRQQGWMGITQWAARPLWWASYDRDGSDPSAGLIPFCGWRSAQAKQFSDKAVFNKRAFDLSIVRAVA